MRRIQAVGDNVLSMHKALNLILKLPKKRKGRGRKREIDFPRRASVLSYHELHDEELATKQS
jgi:hypothetical protein